MQNSIIFLGDIVARSGREAIAKDLPLLKNQASATFVTANGENASGGLGITGVQCNEILTSGVDCITLGDHTYQRKEVRNFLSELAAPQKMIRPANFPKENPGVGYTCLPSSAGSVVVVNIMGRTFMTPTLDCPFKCFDELWPIVSNVSKVILVDFHAEATSEKIAFANYVRGRASLVVGTHTHVQTADEQILAEYTGYISDLGMCGSQTGVIGLKSEIAINRFRTGMSEGYVPDESKGTLNGVHVLIDSFDGKCLQIKRIKNSELCAN